MADNVTTEDIRNWHLDDRQVFKRLVADSRRGLVLSMFAIAYWIVLEDFGFPNLVQKLVKIHSLVLNTIVEEAVHCIDWLQSVTPPAPVVTVSEMPLTQELMEDKVINFSTVYANRKTVLSKMNKTVFQSLAIGFEDIIQEVSGRSFADLNVQSLAENKWNNGGDAYRYFCGQQSAPTVGGPSVHNGVSIVMYPFTPSASVFVEGSTSVLPMTHPNHTVQIGQDEHLSEIKRAIFFTFTRENPVHQNELKSFLESSFGDGCIEKVTMQQVPEKEHPLWASVVFYSEIPVHALMQGRETAPININGKEAWAGKEWLL